MATHLLTPNAAHPLTGLTNPVLGWEFSGSTAMDVFEGCNRIIQAGWNWVITPDPANAELWQMQLTLTGSGAKPLTVKDTDWFAFDGYFVRVLPLADVQANYTISAYTPPA